MELAPAWSVDDEGGAAQLSSGARAKQRPAEDYARIYSEFSLERVTVTDDAKVRRGVARYKPRRRSVPDGSNGNSSACLEMLRDLRGVGEG